MENVRIAVCDDSREDREYIAALAGRWAASRGLGHSVGTFESAENYLFLREDGKGCDILLLDIEMGGMDGVTLAKSIRREDETVQIVFITGYTDYIAEGYEVSALHYLIKPVSEEKLFTVLDRALRRLAREERTLTLETSEGAVRVPLRRIRYAEVMRNYVTVHAERDYTARMTLSELETRLDERFLRVGRSTVVNLTGISRVTRAEIVLESGERLPLPRGAYDALNRAIIELE